MRCRPDVLRVCSSYYRNTPRELRMAVIERVAAAHDVTVDEVMGRSVQRHISNARKAAMQAIAAEFNDDSSVMIGRLFDRDHTTVLSALGTISKRKVAA
jgi:chromosomal replication initiation ATPase DnaA